MSIFEAFIPKVLFMSGLDIGEEGKGYLSKIGAGLRYGEVGVGKPTPQKRL